MDLVATIGPLLLPAIVCGVVYSQAYRVYGMKGLVWVAVIGTIAAVTFSQWRIQQDLSAPLHSFERNRLFAILVWVIPSATAGFIVARLAKGGKSVFAQTASAIGVFAGAAVFVGAVGFVLLI